MPAPFPTDPRLWPSAIVQPDAASKIWRYVDLAKFVALLHKRALYLPSVTSYRAEDSHEGATLRVPYTALITSLRKAMSESGGEPPAENLEGFTQGFMNRHVNAMRELSTRTYLSCWHLSEHESFAMWKIYGGSLALRSSVTALRRCGMPEHARYGMVRYVDFDRDTGAPDSDVVAKALAGVRSLFGADRFFHKREAFRYEQEYRVVVVDPDSEPARPGKLIDVDLTQLIEEIYVQPDADPWFVEVVESLCEQYAPLLKKRIKQSAMATEPLF